MICSSWCEPLSSGTTLAEGLRGWREAAAAGDAPGFADDLEHVNRSDQAPHNP
jgi:hypothetical protein